jgi:hypothetical protein
MISLAMFRYDHGVSIYEIFEFMGRQTKAPEKFPGAYPLHQLSLLGFD